MNETEFPHLHADRGATPDEPFAPPSAANATTFIVHLNRIGNGAAANGQPWPERYLPPGRRLALADADGALAGLRVVHKILLAAERTRQNGESEEYVEPGDGAVGHGLPVIVRTGGGAVAGK